MKKIFFSACLSMSYMLYGQIESLQEPLQQIANSKKATVSVAVRDLISGEEIGILQNKRLPLLSVFKIHVALAVLRQVDQGHIGLNDKILITSEMLPPNTWSPMREKYADGKSFISIEELLDYMVAQSDNNATDILIDKIGGLKAIIGDPELTESSDIELKHNEASMHLTEKHLYENSGTTRGLVNTLQKIHEVKLLSQSTNDLLKNMMFKTSTGNNKLRAGLPANTKIAHKTGSSGQNVEGLTIAENDAGIVYLPNGKTYAIAVLVSDSKESPEANTKIIADISKTVYNYFSKK